MLENPCSMDAMGLWPIQGGRKGISGLFNRDFVFSGPLPGVGNLVTQRGDVQAIIVLTHHSLKLFHAGTAVRFCSAAAGLVYGRHLGLAGTGSQGLFDILISEGIAVTDIHGKTQLMRATTFRVM